MKPDWKGASNVQPKKVKKPSGQPWECGCKRTRPGYLFYCSTCGKSQAPPG